MRFGEIPKDFIEVSERIFNDYVDSIGTRYRRTAWSDVIEYRDQYGAFAYMDDDGGKVDYPARYYIPIEAAKYWDYPTI